MIQALQQHNIKKPANAGFANNWLEYLDSNQGNARFRVWCLTAWLYSNLSACIILNSFCCFVKKISEKVDYPKQLLYDNTTQNIARERILCP